MDGLDALGEVCDEHVRWGGVVAAPPCGVRCGSLLLPLTSRIGRGLASASVGEAKQVVHRPGDDARVVDAVRPPGIGAPSDRPRRVGCDLPSSPLRLGPSVPVEVGQLEEGVLAPVPLVGQRPYHALPKVAARELGKLLAFHSLRGELVVVLGLQVEGRIEHVLLEVLGLVLPTQNARCALERKVREEAGRAAADVRVGLIDALIGGHAIAVLCLLSLLLQGLLEDVTGGRPRALRAVASEVPVQRAAANDDDPAVVLSYRVAAHERPDLVERRMLRHVDGEIVVPKLLKLVIEAVHVPRGCDEHDNLLARRHHERLGRRIQEPRRHRNEVAVTPLLGYLNLRHDPRARKPLARASGRRRLQQLQLTIVRRRHDLDPAVAVEIGEDRLGQPDRLLEQRAIVIAHAVVERLAKREAALVLKRHVHGAYRQDQREEVAQKHGVRPHTVGRVPPPGCVHPRRGLNVELCLWRLEGPWASYSSAGRGGFGRRDRAMEQLTKRTRVATDLASERRPTYDELEAENARLRARVSEVEM